MAVLENGYKENMEQDEAVALVVAAIEAGIYHDLGSGSNVDCAVIKKGKVEYLRNLKTDNFKVFSKPDGYQFRDERVVVLNQYGHPNAQKKGVEEENKMQID